MKTKQMTEKEREQRDAARDIGAELLQAVRDIKAGKVGKVNMVDVSIATQARQRLGMSQAQFSGMMGVSVRTLQDWEQGRREPSGAAKTLLRVAALCPDAVREAIAT